MRRKRYNTGLMQKRVFVNKSSSLTDKLLGEEESFPFEHRIFNMICVITLAILLAFLCINVFISSWSSAILLSVLFLLQLGYYVLSRSMYQYENILPPYILTVYAGLVANYFFNAGINGPTLLFFFTTLQLVLTLSVRNRYIFWMSISAMLPATLIIIDYYYPHIITGHYSGKVPKIIDHFGCYILSIIYIVCATASFKKHLQQQREKERDSQQALIGYGFRLRAFFESLHDSFILLDKEMNILYFNKSAEELSVNFYGKRMQEQQNLEEFMHHSTRDRVMACFNKALMGEKVQEDFKRDYDGRVIWWQLTFNPARDDNGEVIGVTVIMKDITEALLYKLKIEKKNAQLERIAFIQAHELRGPLTSVQSLLALIKDEYGEMDLVYTEKLEEGLLKLDNKIKEIVALSSET